MIHDICFVYVICDGQFNIKGMHDGPIHVSLNLLYSIIDTMNGVMFTATI